MIINETAIPNCSNEVHIRNNRQPSGLQQREKLLSNSRL